MKRSLLIAVLLAQAVFFGCSRGPADKKAERYSNLARRYYELAVSRYTRLIESLPAERREGLYFLLGKLYYEHGNYQKAIEAFRSSGTGESKRMAALSLYKEGDFIDALEIFEKNDFQDPASLYYYGMTCEKLNLFDKALRIYEKVGPGEFFREAKERAQLIERGAQEGHIEDIDPQTSAIIAAAAGQESYPQAGALVVKCDEEVRVTPEDTQVTEGRYIIKILNERGKERFSEAHIEYDSTYEKVVLEYARTIKPDGTVVRVGNRHLRDVSKYLNFPLYSNARIFIISFPEVSDSAVIEYKFRIVRNQLINKKDFVLRYPVQESEPVVSASFRVRVPKGRELNMRLINEEFNDFNATLTPSVSQEADENVYAWEFKDIPQIIEESDMPAFSEINPTIALSSFSSWQEVYDWWWQLVKDKPIADEPIKEKVKELTYGLQDAESRARAVYDYCARQIRYVAVEYGQAGYEPHEARDIFRNKYGDCKDQSVLLVSMLKEAGLDAWPVLIGTRDYYNLIEDFPSVSFNHCIAAVEVSGKTVFLDPTAETCAFQDLPTADQERKVLSFTGSGPLIMETPVFGPESNILEKVFKAELDKEEHVSAQSLVSAFGAFGQRQRYWFLYTQPELIKESLAKRIQEYCVGAQLGNFTMENMEDFSRPMELRYSFEGEEYLTHAGALRIMPQLGTLDNGMVAKESRRYALDSGAAFLSRYSYELKLPPGYSVFYMPSSFEEDNPWFNFMVEYKFKHNTIYFYQALKMKKRLIEPLDYRGFKEAFEAANQRIKQRLILEKKR